MEREHSKQISNPNQVFRGYNQHYNVPTKKFNNNTWKSDVDVSDNDNDDIEINKKCVLRIKGDLEYKIAKAKLILKSLYEAKKQNISLKEKLTQKYEGLNLKQEIIENTNDKIKRITKSKQKKHIKYLRYIPLTKIYFYSPKKIHFYYHLIDLVIKSLKKNRGEDYRIQVNFSKKLNRYKFSKMEDSLLTEKISSSINVNWVELADEIQKSPLECFVRNLELLNFYNYKKWSLSEDSILKRAILYYGPKNWQQISYCLEGRNNSQCFHRWMKGINPKIKRSKWSYDEDLTLGIALKIYGDKKWSKIGNHIEQRTDIQCRERFCNILDPNLTEINWSKDEDLRLLSLFETYGNKWSKIAKELGNRTDNTCWRRWKFLTTNFPRSNEAQTFYNNNLNGLMQLEEELSEDEENNNNLEEFDNNSDDLSKEKMFSFAHHLSKEEKNEHLNSNTNKGYFCKNPSYSSFKTLKKQKKSNLKTTSKTDDKVFNIYKCKISYEEYRDNHSHISSTTNNNLGLLGFKSGFKKQIFLIRKVKN